MKKVLACLALNLLVLCSTISSAQSWYSVGSPGCSDGPTWGYHNSIAIDSGGVLYVAIQDSINGAKATVMKYTDNSWSIVGSAGFSAGGVTKLSIALNPNSVPCVAYTDLANNGKVTVMQYDGSVWLPIGQPGFSPGYALYTTFAIDYGGTPYVSFRDSVHGNKATVMKYKDGSWVIVGGAGFSAGSVTYNSIAIDATGEPFVVFCDSANGSKATVMTYDGFSWVNAGFPAFSAGQVVSPSIVIDNHGSPYVVYADWSIGGKATVMKNVKDSTDVWINVGAPGISGGTTGGNTITLAPDGTPYVVFSDVADSGKTTVMTYDGSAWATIGSRGFSAGNAPNPSIAIGKDGTPYVYYRDGANNDKLTVMRYGAPTGVKIMNRYLTDLSVFPDPNNGTFTLNISSAQSEIATITINNILGEKVKEIKAITNTETTLKIDDVPGVYFVTAALPGGSITKKVLVE